MQTIKATSKDHLRGLINFNIDQYGLECDLNHIDISDITDLSYLFKLSKFNGDISKWNTSNVSWMEGMFSLSKFNGDISQWNTSKVRDMKEMFYMSEFNGDVSKWDVSSVNNFSGMFFISKFQGDISNWQIYERAKLHYVFKKTYSAPLFYLQFIQDNSTKFPENDVFVSEFNKLKQMTDSLNLNYLDAAKYMHVYFSNKNYEVVNFNEFGI